MWNRDEDPDPDVCTGRFSFESLNFEKKLFLFDGLLCSSFSPTSSNPSSLVGSGAATRASAMADRGRRGTLAESRLCLPRPLSGCIIGDLAEISYKFQYTRYIPVFDNLRMSGGMNQRTRGRLRTARSRTSKPDGWRLTSLRGWTVEARSPSSLAVRAVMINY